MLFTRNRLFRPRQIFHELLQGLVSQILGWSPSSTSRWYRAYGRPTLICIVRFLDFHPCYEESQFIVDGCMGYSHDGTRIVVESAVAGRQRSMVVWTGT